MSTIQEQVTGFDASYSLKRENSSPGTGRERLLLISYQFPPLGGVGVQRALSLAKFFPQCDYEVDVLTPSNGVSHTYDSGLENEIPPGVNVHRTMTPEVPFRLRRGLWALMGGSKKVSTSERPRQGTVQSGPPQAVPRQGIGTLVARLARRIVFPDPQFGWRYTAGPRAVDLIRRRGIGTVVVTVPPFSTLGIIRQIKRELPHVTVVADFRDEWLEYYLKEIAVVKDSTLKVRAQRFQREAVAAADLVVAVTESSIRKLRDQSPGQPREKFAVIPNGYDHTRVHPLAPRPWDSSARTIKIVYTGTVYKPCTPSTYMEALERLPESLRSRFETTFVGRVEDDQAKYVHGKPGVRLLGFLPQAKALAHMEDADYLLLPLTEESVIPGKVYEYLGTEKPILALTPPDSETARLMEETRGGYCVGHDDVAGIARLLESIALGTAAPVFPDRERIHRYRRLNLAERYAKLIRSVQLGSHRTPEPVLDEEAVPMTMAAGSGR
jgi:glycosyltransferase involved in cell wall biosynthesis